MTAVIATTTLGTAVLQQKASRKAQKEAKADAIEAEKQARKAEVFADTEGEGVGSLGQISLEVDDDEVKSEVGSTIRI